MKLQYLTPLVAAFSTLTFACGDGVDMSVPHIHDGEQVIITIQNARNHNVRLKQMDIYQVFLGKLEKESSENTQGKTEEPKASAS